MSQFIHLSQYQVVVCKDCHYAVLPPHINTHLRSKAHQFSPNQRQKVIAEVQKVKGLIQNTDELQASQFPYPTITDPPISALGPIRSDGLKCQFTTSQGLPCSFIVCTLRKIQQHCEVMHMWKKDRKSVV